MIYELIVAFCWMGFNGPACKEVAIREFNPYDNMTCSWYLEHSFKLGGQFNGYAYCRPKRVGMEK